MPRLLLLSVLACAVQAQVSSWITTQDLSRRMAPQPVLPWSAAGGETPTITLDPAARFQKMLGLGASLEPTTCWNLSRLDDAARREVLSRLLSSTEGAGMNLMRICIGTPDFTGDPWYTYDDVPEGETDPDLTRCVGHVDRVHAQFDVLAFVHPDALEQVQVEAEIARPLEEIGREVTVKPGQPVHRDGLAALAGALVDRRCLSNWVSTRTRPSSAAVRNRRVATAVPRRDERPARRRPAAGRSSPFTPGPVYCQTATAACSPAT